MSSFSYWQGITESRFRIVIQMFFIYMIIMLLTRTGLLLFCASNADVNGLSLIKIYSIGFLYDSVFYLFSSVPFFITVFILPNRIWHSSLGKIIIHSVVFFSLYVLSLVALSEFIFWNEFSVRFNFISVDYLIYSDEVIANIIESYPIYLLLTSLLSLCVVSYYFFMGPIKIALNYRSNFGDRAKVMLPLFITVLSAGWLVNQDARSYFENNYNRELASNGPYQFFAAFRSNELDYNLFYNTLSDTDLSTFLKREFLGTGEGVEDNGSLDLKREVSADEAEKPLNVMLVTIESLSADYLGYFGNQDKITPNVDALISDSLLFSDFYATGTRTVRGLEAITLSMPPTPSRSIVKRAGKEGDMWSIGNVLREKGYQSTFLYGGNSYFDNMSNFFSLNGYDVIDKNDIPDNEIKFSNAWGVSDEDLYEEAIKQAGKFNAVGKPFFFHLMTTSNHRPYTYPSNKIDISSGTSRNGAVKYSDFAIGKFLQQAKRKKWFDDTIFVFVADHCAGSDGRESLPLNRYHIPMLIYSPKHVTPGVKSRRASQIDLAPTLMSLLNMSYKSYFFGQDILSEHDNPGRALVSNYQHLGLYEGDDLVVLSPKKLVREYDVRDIQNPIRLASLNEFSVKKATFYYQLSSQVFKGHLNAWKQHH